MSVSFADIRAMLADTAEWNPKTPEGFTKALTRLDEAGLALAANMQTALGALAAAQNKAWPALKHPRVALYACGYESGNETTQSRLQDLAEGKDAALRLCALVNADLRAYELDMAAASFDEAALAHALDRKSVGEG